MCFRCSTEIKRNPRSIQVGITLFKAELSSQRNSSISIIFEHSLIPPKSVSSKESFKSIINLCITSEKLRWKEELFTQSWESTDLVLVHRVQAVLSECYSLVLFFCIQNVIHWCFFFFASAHIANVFQRWHGNQQEREASSYSAQILCWHLGSDPQFDP